MRKLSAVMVLGLFLGSGLGCSSDDKAGSTADPKYAQAAERLGCSSPGSDSCKEADFTPQTKCLAPKCAEAYVACFGPDYAKGVYAGVCAGYMGCVGLCPCGDTACRAKCMLGDCLPCLLGQIVPCANKNAMECPAPACVKTAGGTPPMGMPDAGAKP